MSWVWVFAFFALLVLSFALANYLYRTLLERARRKRIDLLLPKGQTMAQVVKKAPYRYQKKGQMYQVVAKQNPDQGVLFQSDSEEEVQEWIALAVLDKR